MPDSTYTFRVDEELKESFTAVAGEQERSAAQLLRALMRDAVDARQNQAAHDAWFRSEVERALGEADEPDAEFTDHETVRTQWQAQSLAFERQAKRYRA